MKDLVLLTVAFLAYDDVIKVHLKLKLKIQNSVNKAINYDRRFNCDNITALWFPRSIISSSGYSNFKC